MSRNEVCLICLGSVARMFLEAQAESLASKTLNEIIRYGGLYARRGEVIADLEAMGVKGPALLNIMNQPAISEKVALEAPAHMWFRPQTVTGQLNQLLGETDRRIAKLFVDKANEISLRLASGQFGALEERRLAQIQAQILGQLKGLSNGYYDELVSGLSKGSRLALQQSALTGKGYVDLLEQRFNGSRLRVANAFQQINTDAVRAAFEREWADGIKLSQRIWDLEKATEQQVLDIIRAGMAEGKSAADIAIELQVHLAPERAEAFIADGRRYITGKIQTMKPYGRNLPYDSMRLARTEITQAFRDSQAESAKVSPWVNALKWNRSAVEYDCDECDAYETDDVDGLGPGIYKPESLPISHPHCKCYTTEETPSLEEFGERLRLWVVGGKDTGLDTWYSEVYQKAA